jgi:polyketide biosynthesis acyl carrier protein
MEKIEVFQKIKEIIIDVLPEVQLEDILINKQLRDLGANSIDRADIVTRSMECLGVKIPVSKFSNVKNIEGLVDLLHEVGYGSSDDNNNHREC